MNSDEKQPHGMRGQLTYLRYAIDGFTSQRSCRGGGDGHGGLGERWLQAKAPRRAGALHDAGAWAGGSTVEIRRLEIGNLRYWLKGQ